MCGCFVNLGLQLDCALQTPCEAGMVMNPSLHQLQTSFPEDLLFSPQPADNEGYKRVLLLYAHLTVLKRQRAAWRHCRQGHY